MVDLKKDEEIRTSCPVEAIGEDLLRDEEGVEKDRALPLRYPPIVVPAKIDPIGDPRTRDGGALRRRRPPLLHHRLC